MPCKCGWGRGRNCKCPLPWDDLKPAVRANLPPNKVIKDKKKYTRKSKHKKLDF